MTHRTSRIAVLAALAILLGVSAGCLLRRNQQAAAPPAPASAAPPPAADASGFKPDEFAEISVRAQASRIPVIMYHDIIAKRTRRSVYFDCTRAEFAAQMDYLKEQGAHPVSLLQLHKHLVQGDPLPDNAIVLTFDDNYQGFYDNAYSLLKANSYPAAMFVHTNFVGDKTGDHPHMSWDTLLQLDKEGLVTIASHTESHPDDITKLAVDAQERELTGSKQALEAKLGHTVPYFAYPDGKNDETTRGLVQKAGYTMAFTIENGPVEESPGVLALNRYIHTRLKKAIEDCKAARAYAAFYEHPLVVDSPVRLEVKELAGVPVGIVQGGLPSSRRAPVRTSVGTFVEQASAVAGINGTFFADARLVGTGCTLIGPAQSSVDTEFQPETDKYRLTRIGNRPIVLWGPRQIAIFPFQPGTMNSQDIYKAYMPDYTDLFLAGAWIVHDGKARTEEDLKPAAAGDFQDTRRRAFFGITAKGEPILGATLTVVSTTKMAEAAAEAGAQEAVLLDSGFSTSLVYDKKIIVTGHTDKNLPSRPVPHAIVVTGKLARPDDKQTVAALKDADPATVPGESGTQPDPEALAGTNLGSGPSLGPGGASSLSPGAPDAVAPFRRRRRRPRTRRRRRHSAESPAAAGTPAAPPGAGGSGAQDSPPPTVRPGQ
ncbi:MAG TPA: polysaccharide deacetylase family protein [Chthonomonadaceae bacterium]|nr:polysaccharide deacetylase family protein [Chthonomonadaceae bacterium]